MGANIASTYTDLRSDRVSQLVMRDFLGLAVPSDTNGAQQLNQWLSAVENTPEMRGYKTHEVLARRLMSVNHRLTEKRAEFLFRSVSYVRPDGLVAMACDPWHNIPSPALYLAEDSIASWQLFEAPVLLLFADQGFIHQRFADKPDELQRRLACFKGRHVITISDAGHNVQQDQPKQVALALEQFLA
jgi:pimeloyl-ACP methyl ester carboxylesterase